RRHLRIGPAGQDPAGVDAGIGGQRARRIEADGAGLRVGGAHRGDAAGSVSGRRHRLGLVVRRLLLRRRRDLLLPRRALVGATTPSGGRLTVVVRDGDTRRQRDAAVVTLTRQSRTGARRVRLARGVGGGRRLVRD